MFPWTFGQNTGKTQGILFAQIVSSLILNIQDIAIFAVKFSDFSQSVSHMKLLQISEIGTEKFSSWTGKEQGNHRQI